MLTDTKDLENEVEGGELLTIKPEDGHEGAQTTADIEKTCVRDRPSLRQLYGAQNPKLPQCLQPRRLRISFKVEIGHKGDSSSNTFINPDDGHQPDSGSTTINGSLENSVNQIGESRVGLRSSEKAAETEGHSSPLSANTEPQEHQHPPLEFKKKDNSDRASPKSSNSKAWEEVVATMEWSHEGDLLDLREEMEALKARPTCGVT